MTIRLGEEDFIELLGVSRLPEWTTTLLHQLDFEYQPLTDKERDTALLDILRRIHDPVLRPSGDARQGDWDKGWGENLQEFIDTNYDLAALIPKYFKPNPILRLKRTLVRPTTPNFELNYIKVVRSIVAAQYFQGLSNLFEFGCGTGYHLVGLAQQLPDLNICGMDWAKPTVEIINLLAKRHDLKIAGRHFDYFNPDNSLQVPEKSGFFTFASLEQIGDQHHKFIDFILAKHPDVCVHVECIAEFYDEGNFMDYLALLYHRKRNYLSGFLSRLIELEREGKASILRSHRVQFGSAYHDAYSIVVWKPL